MPLLLPTLHAAKDVSEPLTNNGVVELSYLELSFLLLSLAVVVITSQRLSLDIEKQLAIGATRCLVQLSALGLVLVPIIKYNNPPLVLAYVVFMMFIAAIEASSRPPYIFDALFLVCFVCIATTVTIFALFTFTVVVPVGLNAQYIIPVIGMIAGNSMSAVSVAVSCIVTNLAEHKHDIELLLALGATRWEASIHLIKSSIKLGLTPTLNTMSVAGLVAIPGMMTGQVSKNKETSLLINATAPKREAHLTTSHSHEFRCASLSNMQIIGGTPPSTAAKYQLVIMYVAAGTATVSTLTASFLTVRVLIDNEHRIRTEKLSHRDSVNRIGSILSSARYLGETFWNWRSQSLQRGSPFPSHVQWPLPSSHSEALPKTEGDEANDYGSVQSR